MRNGRGAAAKGGGEGEKRRRGEKRWVARVFKNKEIGPTQRRLRHLCAPQVLCRRTSCAGGIKKMDK